MLRKLLIAAVIVLLILSIFPMVSWWGSIFMRTVDLREELDLSGSASVSIKTVSADIRFAYNETNQSDQAVFTLTGKSNKGIKLSAERTATGYHIETQRKRGIPFVSMDRSRDLELIVMLPAKVFSADGFSSLSVQSVSGDIDLRNTDATGRLSVESCNLRSVSGDLFLPDGQYDSLVASTVSGNILAGSTEARSVEVKTTSGNIRFDSVTGLINAKTVSGNISALIAEISDRIELHTVSGDIELDIPADSNISVSFSTVSGDLRTDAPIETTQSHDRGVKGTLGTGQYPLVINTTSGNVRLY